MNELLSQAKENLSFLGITAAVIIALAVISKLTEKKFTHLRHVSPARRVSIIGICSAIAVVLHILDFPLPFLAPEFYKLDFSEVPVLLGGFVLGPSAAVAIEGIKILLQLLLKSMPSGSLLATGIWGGRFDHLFSNVYTLLGVKQQRGGVVLLADEQELMLLLEADEDVELELHAEVEAVSLLPLSAETCVDFSGVHWPLKNAALKQLYPYAISNVPSGKDARLHCSCHAGAVGLYIRWQDERISINN